LRYFASGWFYYGKIIIRVRFKHYSKFVTRKFALKVEEIVDKYLLEKIVK